jgi:pilus assembly protein CpaE
MPVIAQFNILIVSRKNEVIEAIDKALSDGGYTQVSKKLLKDKSEKIIYKENQIPDLIILHVTQHWKEEIQAILVEKGRVPKLIAITETPEAGLIKMVMRAGAMDLVTLPLASEELLEAVARARKTIKVQTQKKRAHVVSLMNTQGGSGSSVISVNVAHVLACKFKQKVALIDLDIQFGTLPLYLDLRPVRGLSQAIENIDSSDEESIKGYFTHHQSGIDVISNGVKAKAAHSSLNADSFLKLMDLVGQAYDQIIIDLPRRFDEINSEALLKSDTVALVMRQSLVSVAGAKKIMDYLNDVLNINKSEIVVVVNCYESFSSITLEDISVALGHQNIVTIPREEKIVSYSVNSGVPLLSHENNKALGKSILSVSSKVSGKSVPARPSFVRRAAAMIAGDRL